MKVFLNEEGYVAVCEECGWKTSFRRIIGVGEALVASALMEEALAIHGGLCHHLRIELRPEEQQEIVSDKCWRHQQGARPTIAGR